MQVEDIKHVCNLGTGTMGSGTALVFALAGCHVRMHGRTETGIDRAFKNIQAACIIFCAHGLLTESAVPELLSRIRAFTTLEEAAQNADFVIESIAEDLDVKRQVFERLEILCRRDTVFATNTSGLSPTAIADCLEYKDRFVVAHFWNPAHLVPLVEVVPGRFTSRETVDITWRFMEKIGKKPVALKREALGFIGNRLQLALLREALYIVESGIATPEAVDAAMKYGMGRRLSTTGPLESVDLGGLDIFYNISRYLLKELCNSSEPPSILKNAVEKGTLGAKTGSGIYDWTPERLAEIKKQREDHLIEWLKKDKTGQDMS